MGVYLSPPFFCELDSVVGDHLVDGSVFVALRLGVTDQYYEAWFTHGECVTLGGLLGGSSGWVRLGMIWDEESIDFHMPIEVAVKLHT